MYFTIFKLALFLFITGKINCASQSDSSQQSQFESSVSKDKKLEHLSANHLEQLKQNYIKLRPLLKKLLQMDEQDQDELMEFVLESSNDYDGQQSANRDRDMLKRAYYSNYMGGSGERYDRVMKGKRVKNMFSSGLQGVWGVPGRR